MASAATVYRRTYHGYIENVDDVITLGRAANANHLPVMNAEHFVNRKLIQMPANLSGTILMVRKTDMEKKRFTDKPNWGLSRVQYDSHLRHQDPAGQQDGIVLRYTEVEKVVGSKVKDRVKKDNGLVRQTFSYPVDGTMWTFNCYWLEADIPTLHRPYNDLALINYRPAQPLAKENPQPSGMTAYNHPALYFPSQAAQFNLAQSQYRGVAPNQMGPPVLNSPHLGGLQLDQSQRPLVQHPGIFGNALPQPQYTSPGRPHNYHQAVDPNHNIDPLLLAPPLPNTNEHMASGSNPAYGMNQPAGNPSNNHMYQSNVNMTHAQQARTTYTGPYAPQTPSTPHTFNTHVHNAPQLGFTGHHTSSPNSKEGRPINYDYMSFSPSPSPSRE